MLQASPICLKPLIRPSTTNIADRKVSAAILASISPCRLQSTCRLASTQRRHQVRYCRAPAEQASENTTANDADSADGSVSKLPRSQSVDTPLVTVFEADTKLDDVVTPPTSPDRYSYDIEMNEGSNVTKDDVSIIIIACLIGLSTGLGVVVFQNVVHYIQDHLVWGAAPALAAFAQSNLASWKSLVVPPIVAGFVVSALRALAGGFDGDPRALAVGSLSPALPAPLSLIPASTSQPPTVAALQLALNRARARADAEKSRKLGATAKHSNSAQQSSQPSLHSPESSSGSEMTSTPPQAVIQGPFSPVRRSAARRLAIRLFLRPYLKLLAAAVTLGSGASLGPEGPSADLGKANAERWGKFVPSGVRLSLSNCIETIY